MIWQDFIFSAGSITFIAALVRMVVEDNPPPLIAAATTGLTLAMFAYCYATLSLTFAAITTAVSALLWLALAVQRWRKDA